MSRVLRKNDLPRPGVAAGAGLGRRHAHRRLSQGIQSALGAAADGQGAVVLLISGDLDSDAGEGLAKEIERLNLAGRWLVWLNPLLRYEAFQAKPAGIRAMLPHVDVFLPVHNLASLRQFRRTLGGVSGVRRETTIHCFIPGS